MKLAEKKLCLKDLVDVCQTTKEGRDIIHRQASILKQFEKLGAEPVRLAKLLVCEVSDVFGGMGSWNDQHVPSEYYEKYSKISHKFYSTLKRYRAELISGLD